MGGTLRADHLSGRDAARLAQVADDIDSETLILLFDVRDEAAMTAATWQAIDWPVE